ncbi:MAG: phosphate/phosphite/phosphonate ABC transporter substrate-binding protein [Dissulfurispiraceae bacterium]
MGKGYRTQENKPIDKLNDPEEELRPLAFPLRLAKANREIPISPLIIAMRCIFIVLIMLIFSVKTFASEAFVIGVAPHTSARVILKLYEPLRLYLEKSLGRPVEVITAPDFSEFARRALAQAYDIAITTGHQARLLQTDAHYLPLLTYKTEFRAVALVADKGRIHNAKDLKGTNVIGLSAASLVTLWGQHWLIDNDLSDVSVQYVSASDSVAELVIAGEAAAGFVSTANFDELSPKIKGQVRVLAESRPMVGRVYLLNSRQAQSEKVIDAALWDFAGTVEGRRYFDENKLGGYRKLKPNELKSMDKYAAEVRKVLRESSR